MSDPPTLQPPPPSATTPLSFLGPLGGPQANREESEPRVRGMHGAGGFPVPRTAYGPIAVPAGTVTS